MSDQRHPDKRSRVTVSKPKQKVRAVPENMKPDWSSVCLNCGAKPVVPVTGLCGPCTFGEAETSGGNW